MSDLDTLFNIPYIISNENLRSIVAATPNAKNVLTIAGSGDQALFYTLGGATHVDTFDILSNARTIQDIKTTAISQLSHAEYVEMLRNTRSGSQMSVPAAVQAKLPPHSRSALKTLIFRNGVYKSDIEKLPTAAEYARMQAIIHAPFNFIHENLTAIHTRVTGPYDVINISNIFDRNYISDIEQQMRILCNLAPLLNVGGVIVYDNQFGYKYKDFTLPIPNSDIRLQHKSATAPRMRLDLFQRTR